jgi:polysaccharide pyruvyl transferase WcaK-like protein
VSEQNISIGLLWHAFDSGNHGVNALTVSSREIAAAAARDVGLEPRFIVFSPGHGPSNEVAPNGDTVIRLNRKTMLTSRTYWSAVRQIDCMLDISAGDSFASIYGAKRFFWMWISKMIVLQQKTPLALCPQTIGPFQREVYLRLAASVMTRANLTVARDPLSYRAVGEIAPLANRLLSADVAFRLPYQPRPHLHDGKVHVGLNVSGLLWSQSGSGSNAYGLSYDYADVMLHILDHLSERPEFVVHLITHVVDSARPLDNDGPLADYLSQRYPNFIRVPDFAGPSEAKSYISGLDLLIAARMHACIAAFSSGVAVIPIAYSRKFEGLFSDLLKYTHTLLPTGHDNALAVNFIISRIERRDELSRAVIQGNERVQPLLESYSHSLRQLFVTLSERRNDFGETKRAPWAAI